MVLFTRKVSTTKHKSLSNVSTHTTAVVSRVSGPITYAYLCHVTEINHSEV